jgi:hypothetical protein
MMEKLGHQVEGWMNKAQSVEHHRLDGMACGHHAHLGVLLRRAVNDVTNAEFIRQACDKAQMIQHLRSVGRLL